MAGTEDLVNVLLSNIQTVDIAVIRKIAEIIPKTSLQYFTEVFNFIVEYYDTQKEIPSPDFIQARFPMIFVKTNEPLSREAIKILQHELKKDSTITETLMALQDRDLDDARAILEKGILKADFTETKASDICNLYDAMNDLPEGLQTGVQELDNVYKNFSYGTNNFIAAPQKAGKTTVAISLSYDALMKRGMNVVYVTLEVKPSDIYANLFARHAYEIGEELNAQSVKKNLLDEDERKTLQKVQESFIDCMTLQKGNISVVGNSDFPEFTQDYLKQYLEDKYEEWGRVDLVVIDHCNLLGYYAMRGVKDMKERINSWIKYTTDLAKGFHEKGFILVSLMQINRQGTLQMKKGKSVGFDILADANEAERSAHTITVLYSNPEMLMAKQVRLYCLANRNGPPLTSENEDNSIDTRLDPSIYLLGNRKHSDSLMSILSKEKDLLKEIEEENEATSSLFSSMI